MEILKIVEALERFSQDLVAYKMGGEFADAVSEAASLLVGQGEKIADLENKVAEMESRNRWIPVTERLPEQGQEVLAFSAQYSEYQIGWMAGSEDCGIVCFGDGVELYFVTHWMPLPEPPKEDE